VNPFARFTRGRRRPLTPVAARPAVTGTYNPPRNLQVEAALVQWDQLAATGERCLREAGVQTAGYRLDGIALRDGPVALTGHTHRLRVVTVICQCHGARTVTCPRNEPWQGDAS